MARALWAGLAARDDWTDADLRGLAEDRAWLGLLPRDGPPNMG